MQTNIKIKSFSFLSLFLLFAFLCAIFASFDFLSKLSETLFDFFLNVSFTLKNYFLCDTFQTIFMVIFSYQLSLQLWQIPLILVMHWALNFVIYDFVSNALLACVMDLCGYFSLFLIQVCGLLILSFYFLQYFKVFQYLHI